MRGWVLVVLWLGACGARSDLDVEQRRLDTLLDGGRVDEPDGGRFDGGVRRDAGEVVEPCTIDGPAMLAQLGPSAGLFNVGADATHVYLPASEAGELWRIPLCGGPTELLAEGVRPFDVASDGRFAYWTDANGAGGVRRTSLSDRSTVELWSGPAQAEGLVIDDTHVYFTVVASTGLDLEGVWRVPKAGGTAERLHAGRVPRELTLDESGFLYFFADRSLVRVPATGGPPEELLADRFVGGTIVVRDGSVYWTEWGGSGDPNVLGMRLPRGDIQVFHRGERGVVVGLAVDATHIYWTSQQAGTVRGLPLDSPGSRPITIAEGQETVEHIVLIDGGIAWVNFGDDRAWRAPRL